VALFQSCSSLRQWVEIVYVFWNVIECMCVQTTPPCAEGLRWHVFTTHIAIPLSTVRNYEAKFVNIIDPATGDVPPQLLQFCFGASFCCEVA
jgi:hypothetical protein